MKSFLSCETWSLHLRNRLSWQTNDWSKTSLFSHWNQSQLACTSAKVEKKKRKKESEMLCKSVKDKQNRTKSHVFLNSNEWILFYRVCVSVQCTDYIHISWYTIFFLLFSCILLINQTVKQRERERERDLWLSRRLWKDPGRKFQTQGRNHQQSEAYQATLTRNLSSMISPSTISDSASPLLYRFDSAPASALSDPYPSYLSLCLSLISFSVLIFAVSVSLCSCVFLLLSRTHMSCHI